MAWWRGQIAPVRGLSLHGVLWWLLAALIATLLAALAWSIVTPVSPLGDWRPAGVRVIPAPARATLFASVDPFNRAPAAPATATAQQPGTVTSLALVLFGTRSSPGGTGSAIIAGADGLQQVYRVGTKVMDGVTLAEVAFDHVVLERNGARELLYIDQSGAVPDAAAPPRAVPSGPIVPAPPAGLATPMQGAPGVPSVPPVPPGVPPAGPASPAARPSP